MMGKRYNIYNVFPFYVLIIFSIFILVAGSSYKIKCPVQSLYQFGDSFSDTGNLIRIPGYIGSLTSRLPYGITYPGNGTGRASDGRLIIDYIAIALGLPLLNPYLDMTASFDNGVNFAVGGATAVNASFYTERGIGLPAPGAPSLSDQLGWFLTYLHSLHSPQTDTLRNSLVFEGEIGTNDIIALVFNGRSIQEIYTYIPRVVEAITNNTRDVIRAGSPQVVVPGVFPLGCFPWALIRLNSTDPTSYDDLGCLKSLNRLTAFLNGQLQLALINLRIRFPNVVILYADYYNAFTTVLRKATTFGFDAKNLLKPCCGDGSFSMYCGSPNATVCPNPNKYIHWDGVHLTQEAYRRISEIQIIDLKIKCT